MQCPRTVQSLRTSDDAATLAPHPALPHGLLCYHLGDGTDAELPSVGGSLPHPVARQAPVLSQQSSGPKHPRDCGILYTSTFGRKMGTSSRVSSCPCKPRSRPPGCSLAGPVGSSVPP